MSVIYIRLHWGGFVGDRQSAVPNGSCLGGDGSTLFERLTTGSPVRRRGDECAHANPGPLQGQARPLGLRLLGG